MHSRPGCTALRHSRQVRLCTCAPPLTACALQVPHIVNCSMMLGAILMFGRSPCLPCYSGMRLSRAFTKADAAGIILPIAQHKKGIWCALLLRTGCVS